MTIYTIGHSTHSIETFIEMLQAFNIQLLADVRNFPGSKRYPHFNRDNLERSVTNRLIQYKHFKALGGRRKPIPDTKNTGWRVEAFRGYADYMETNAFKDAIAELEADAEKKITAFMCSEAVWWSCHRSLIADHLKLKEWTVLHIMNKNKADEHPYTKPARIVNGKLNYEADTENLLF